MKEKNKHFKQQHSQEHKSCNEKLQIIPFKKFRIAAKKKKTILKTKCLRAVCCCGVEYIPKITEKNCCNFLLLYLTGCTAKPNSNQPNLLIFFLQLTRTHADNFSHFLHEAIFAPCSNIFPPFLYLVPCLIIYAHLL